VHESLIKYIEEAMMDPEATFAKKIDWITVKYSQIEKVYHEGCKIYNDKVKPCMASAKLLELIALNPDFERLKASLKQCLDLGDLSEETIFIEYEAGIQIAGTKPFIGFTKENTEAFYRLKLRSIESRISQGMAPKLQAIPLAQEREVVDGQDPVMNRIFKVEQQLTLISHHTHGLMES
jgi:hypothetical protein